MIKQLSWGLSTLAVDRAGGVSSNAAQTTDCTMEHPMARALRFPLMPALMLALLWPVPGWATPTGVSIALTNVLFDYAPVASNLSAEAAPLGGPPALPLFNNGHYKDTAAGDFAVTVNLPPLDQQNSWLISADLSINGQHVFGRQDVVGPFGVTDVTGAIDEALAQLNPLVQHIVKAIGNDLLTQPQHNGLGLLDWSYNRDPADDNDRHLRARIDGRPAEARRPRVPFTRGVHNPGAFGLSNATDACAQHQNFFSGTEFTRLRQRRPSLATRLSRSWCRNPQHWRYSVSLFSGSVSCAGGARVRALRHRPP
jgi:hypothetical protein